MGLFLFITHKKNEENKNIRSHQSSVSLILTSNFMRLSLYTGLSCWICPLWYFSMKHSLPSIIYFPISFCRFFFPLFLAFSWPQRYSPHIFLTTIKEKGWIQIRQSLYVLRLAQTSWKTIFTLVRQVLSLSAVQYNGHCIKRKSRENKDINDDHIEIEDLL